MGIIQTLSVKDVAKALSMSEQAVYKQAARGNLPARKMGKRLIFLVTDLTRYLESLPRK